MYFLSVLSRTRRLTGQNVTDFLHHMQDICDEVLARVGSDPVEVNVMSDVLDMETYRHLLDECPEMMRSKIEQRFSYRNILEVVEFIKELTTQRPSQSPFSDQNLAIERRTNETFMQRQRRINRAPSGTNQNAGNRNYQNGQQNRRTNQLSINNTESYQEYDEAEDQVPETEGATLAEVDEQAACNFVGKCYKCQQQGHLARDCTKSDTVKQTVTNGGNRNYNKKAIQFKKNDKNVPFHQNKDKYKKNFRNSNDKSPYYCKVCRKNGHTLTYCFYYKRAKQIINELPNEDRRVLQTIAQENPEDENLQELTTAICESMESYNEDLDTEAIPNLIYALNSTWDGEGEDWASEEEEE